MKKYTYLVIVLIAIAVFPLITNAAWWNPLTWNWNIFGSSSQSQNVNNYTNTKVGNLSISLPPNWKQLKIQGVMRDNTKWVKSGNNEGALAYYSAGEQTSAFSIDANRIIPNFDYSSTIQQNISVQKGVMSSDTKSIGGYMVYVLTRNDLTSNVPIKHYQAYIDGKGEYYVIDYRMKAEDFSKNQKVFDNIINSIKIQK